MKRLIILLSVIMVFSVFACAPAASANSGTEPQGAVLSIGTNNGCTVSLEVESDSEFLIGRGRIDLTGENSLPDLSASIDASDKNGVRCCCQGGTIK